MDQERLNQLSKITKKYQLKGGKATFVQREINIDDLKEMMGNMESLREKQMKIIREYLDKQDEWFEKHLRLNAVPEIKGEITRGKLKWRGITLCRESITGGAWLAQRGKRISPTLLPPGF